MVLSRELSAKEKETFDKKIDLPWQPAKFAADAVLFVVPKNSALESISMDEIANELQSEKKRFIFYKRRHRSRAAVAQKLMNDTVLCRV